MTNPHVLTSAASHLSTSLFKQPRWFSDRHCEPTGRTNARPMTGSAKQSMAPRSKSGLLRRFRLRSLSYGGQAAPRNDVAPIFKTRLRDLAARCVRGLQEPFAQNKQRAQGMPGAQCTRGLACKIKSTRAYRYSRSTPAFPAQWLDGLCRALPGDEFVLPPSLPA